MDKIEIEEAREEGILLMFLEIIRMVLIGMLIDMTSIWNV